MRQDRPFQRQLDYKPSPGAPQLPSLGFSRSLDLLYINDAAVGLFFPSLPAPSTAITSALSARYFLEEAHSVHDAEQRLEVGARECRGLGWGEKGTILELWRGEGAERTSTRAEALVNHLPTEQDDQIAWSILLLRPALSQLSAYESSSCETGSTSNASSSSLPPAIRRPRPTKWHYHPKPSSDNLNELHHELQRVVQKVLPEEGVKTRDVEAPAIAAELASRDALDAFEDYEDPDDALGGPDKHIVTPQEYKALVDTLPIMCFTSSPNGLIEWLNNEWYRYTGLGHHESTQFETWATLFPPEDLARCMPIWLSSTEAGTPFSFEYRIRGVDGQYRWHTCSGSPRRDRHGTIVGWACAIFQVEDLVQARYTAQKTADHVAAVLAGADTVLISVDSENTVTFFEGSAAATRALGELNRDGTIPIVGERIAWPDVKLQQAVEMVLRDGEDGAAELLLERDGGVDGKRWCQYRLVPLKGGPGAPDDLTTGVIIVGSDVTELHVAEQALRQSHIEKAHLLASETAAKEANRLKTDFLTTMSHEIRTPIAGILGICELLLDDPSLAESHRSLVGKAVRSGEILLDLVGMVLDVRKIEAGELTLEEEPLELEAVIADARLFSIQAHRQGINFVEDIGHFYAGPLLGDRLRLRQVLANALSNSVKFTKDGAVTLRVRQERETEDAAHILLEVENTGVGIPEDVLPTLFQPFKQADASTARHYGGTGLGLVITRQLVELMGGTVDLQSTHGKGTTITAHVPLRKAPFMHDPLEATEAPEPAPPGGHDALPKTSDVKVLLAEDNELLRNIVTKTLLKMKFQVDAVEDGAAAVAAASSKYYDVILMDGQMPGLDGYQATSQLRRSEDPRVRNVKIIALTASAIQGDRERCIEAGMDGYLAKPVRAKNLEAEIWAMLKR